MKVKEIKELVKEFSQSLDNKEKDEWWGTDRGIWEGISKKFIMWCCHNRKRIENPEEFAKEQEKKKKPFDSW